MAYTTALVASQIGPTPESFGLISETITVTGAGDTTGTWVTQFVKQPQFVRGPFTYSISGQTVTLGSASLTGVETAQIVGYA